jgi:hypothetical protein
MTESSATTTRIGRAGRIATEYRRRVERALLHESHARHLRADEHDPKCPYCLVERPWPTFTSD